MDEIVIHDSELIGRRLTSRVNVPRSLRKYFKSFNMFVKYDTDISAEKSILNIPLLSTLLPLAWLTGSDIYVDELDITFKESMDKLKQEFKKMYPEAPFTTRINADVLVDNEIGEVNPSERTGLLFSGGVDSTYSLIKNIDLKPRLIMHWGVEGHPYPKYSEYWDKVISRYSEFSRRMGVPFHIIKTNALEVLHERRIEHDFHEVLLNGTFWARLQHSLVLIPLTAPLSVCRFDRLLIAATHDSTFSYSRHPWASRPSTDEKIVWANLQVKHDGLIPRTEKILGVIKEFLKSHKLTLRVCLKRRHSLDKLNCSLCEKCFTTIAPLVLAGIDLKDCGFELYDSTFKLMRKMFEKEKIDPESLEGFWRPIQEMIPDRIEDDLHGSKEFFKWFKNFDLKSAENNVWVYQDLYNILPYPISKVLDEFYTKIGIRIHDHSPIRPIAARRLARAK